MSMDIAKAFTFMFEDPEALRKLAIGTILVLVGILLLVGLVGVIPLIIVAGYGLTVTRNVLDGQAYPLPEWSDWGALLGRGLKLVIVFIVWMLPLIILGLIPTAIGSALLNSQSGGANTLGSLILACSSCLTFIWWIVVAVFTPALYVQLARTDQVSAGFDFTRLWAMTRANLTNVIVAVLMMIVAWIIAGIVAMVGLIALLIGVVVTVPFAILWSMLVEAHLYGQAIAPQPMQIQ